MGTQLPSTKGAQSPVFGPCLLWPNGWMDHDATWYRHRLRPKRHCIRWRPSSPSPKGAQSPIFGPCVVWPDGWMDQDVTWCRRRPRPSSPQKKRHSPQFFANVYCGQTAGWIKMPLGTEVNLDPGDVVLYGVPAPPLKRHSPQFSAHLYCNQTASQATFYETGS